MTSPAADIPSLIGRPASTLDTPALCVDLELLDGNLAAISNALRAAGKAWRPAVGSHHVPEIARRAITLGAIGVTVPTVAAAERFVSAGIPDILIRNLIAGPGQLARVAELASTAAPIVTIDHFVHAEQLDEACRRAGTRVRVIVEINLGNHHTGVRPGPDTQQLLRGIRPFRHIDVVGLTGYEGHLLSVPDTAERERLIRSALQILGDARDRMRQAAIPCDLITAGAPGAYPLTSRTPEPTELQTGDEIFGDPFYRDSFGLTELSPALHCLATVVHRGKLERAVLDCGRTSLGCEQALPRVARVAGGPTLADAEITHLGIDQTRLELGPDSANLRIGDRVEIVPGSSRLTTLLHDRIYAVRGGVVEEVWRIGR